MSCSCTVTTSTSFLTSRGYAAAAAAARLPKQLRSFQQAGSRAEQASHGNPKPHNRACIPPCCAECGESRISHSCQLCYEPEQMWTGKQACANARSCTQLQTLAKGYLLSSLVQR